MGRLFITLLGGFQLRPDSGPVRTLPLKKAQALLAYLALKPGQAHPRNKLAALLWGENSDEQARNSLRQTLFALRKTLPSTKPPPLLSDSETVTLNSSVVEVDVTNFERYVADGTPAVLEQAVALYQGDLLEGLDVNEAAFEEWLMAERERLRELALEALAKLLAHQNKAGATEQAVQTAARLLALDPLQESVHRTLMRLYVSQRRRAAALRQYQLCVAVLQRELGVEPEAETRQLYQEILQQRLQPEPAKGEALPVRPARRRRLRLRPASRAEIPLIGREPELAELRQALAEAKRKHGQLVVVRGESGIGKTRLIEELAAEGQECGARVLIGRAYQSEQILPFGPWVDALRAGQVIEDRTVMEALTPSWRSELVRLFPEAGEHTPMQFSASAEDHLRLFNALAQLVELLASQQPLLLIFEDLHWADEMTQRMVTFIGRRVSPWPVLVVGTAREEEMADASVLWGLLQELDREGRLVQLNLAPLSRPDTEALVRALARKGTEEASLTCLGERIWRLSEGNPFTVVETMRALQTGKTPEDPEQFPLPQRVREVIIQHLGRLSPKSRELTAVAAVIGREFDFLLLQRAAGLSEREAAEGVEEIVRRRILHEVGNNFDFTHDRIREAAYTDLLAPRRQILHTAVGQALEDLHAKNLEEVSDQLAYHYSRGKNADKAVRFLMQSAEKAAWGYAHEQALRALGEATAHVEYLPAKEQDRRLLDIILHQIYYLFSLGRFRECLDLLLRHREVVERVGDPWLAGPYYAWLAHLYNFVENHEPAEQNARRSLDEAARCGDEVTMGRAHWALALSAFWSGRAREGIEHSRLAISLLEGRAEARLWLGATYCSLGVSYFLAGEFELALEALARAETIAEAVHDLNLRCSAAGFMGVLLAQRGEGGLAVATCRRNLALMRTPLDKAMALGCLGYAHLEKGEPELAIPVLEESLQLYKGFEYLKLQGWCAAWLSEAYRLDGQSEKARELAIQGLQITSRALYPYATGYAQRTLGLIARDQGNLAEAEAHLNDALKTFTSIHARYFVGRIHLDLAGLAHAQGSPDQARAHLKEARALFTDLKVPKYAEQAGQRTATLTSGKKPLREL